MFIQWAEWSGLLLVRKGLGALEKAAGENLALVSGEK